MRYFSIGYRVGECAPWLGLYNMTRCDEDLFITTIAEREQCDPDEIELDWDTLETYEE